MRSFAFNILFYPVSTVFVITGALLGLLPGRRPLMICLKAYTRTMMALMRWVAGIRIDVAGKDRLPKDGPFIIAAKHQSYGDGFVMFSQFDDLSFVTGDHLEKYPLIGGILKKAGAVVVNSCGGPEARSALSRSASLAEAEGRHILIYPEGHLSKVGEQHRYRSGVYHMHKDFGWPVVPVATNLGERWSQQDWTKTPGPATVEFLDPIYPGKDKETFMAELERAIETRSRALSGLPAPFEMEHAA